jgi:hypothetical protein
VLPALEVGGRQAGGGSRVTGLIGSELGHEGLQWVHWRHIQWVRGVAGTGGGWQAGRQGAVAGSHASC